MLIVMIHWWKCFHTSSLSDFKLRNAHCVLSKNWVIELILDKLDNLDDTILCPWLPFEISFTRVTLSQHTYGMKQSKATQTFCRFGWMTAMLVHHFLLKLWLCCRAFMNCCHFSFSFKENKTNLLKKKKVWCMQCYRWKSHFNRDLPRWLFETVSLHLYVSKGPLTWLIRGSLVWEMKLHVSQGASSTPSWGPNLNQGHSFLHLQHRSTAPGAVS